MSVVFPSTGGAVSFTPLRSELFGWFPSTFFPSENSKQCIDGRGSVNQSRMPKKKKTGLSPSRGTRQGIEYGTGPENRTPRTNGSAVTEGGSPWRTQSQDKVIQRMQEMFSHLDPEVIYMVLSESDFKVENAMDSLLELSDAAEGPAPPPPHVSGFEQAAALLEAGQTEMDLYSEAAQSSAYPNQPASQTDVTPDETEELDTLLDRELESFTSQQTQAGSLLASVPFSAIPPPSQSFPLSSLPHSSQAHLPAPKLVNQFSSRSEAGGSPVNELSFGGGRIPEQKNVSLDFSHLTVDANSTGPRPSAFQVYRRPYQLHPNAQVSAQSQRNEALSTPDMFWNTQTAEFNPRSVGPAFITPVIPKPTPWNMNPMPAAQWFARTPARQAPLKPSPTLPQSWTLPSTQRLKLEGHVLVLLRGAPGSGKTTLAIAMLDHNPGGVVLSTDDYFIRNGHYHFEPDLLREAHEWNHQRAKEAFEKRQTPIIIDNTNMQCWEMKPYVAMAQTYRYKVLFREPETWWKAKPRELEKRTRHEVSKEKIRRILDRYDRFVSVQSIMNSQKPELVPSLVDLTQPNNGQPQLSLPPGISHPDLVGDSGLSKLNPYLSSSLPDVSSVRQTFSTSPEGGTIGSFGSNGPMLFSENIPEGSGTPLSDLLDGKDLDLELDACLVDSGTTEEKILEQPVAFSESIGQRVKRDRAYDKSLLQKNFIDSSMNLDSSGEPLGQYKKKEFEDEPCSKDNVVQPELLDFVGDWPMESLGQREGRQHGSRNHSVKNMDCSAVEETESISSDEEKQSDTEKMKQVEFQKLIDLLQGNSSPASQRSPLLSGREDDLNLETWSDLPDCVQKSSEDPDPSQDLLSSSVPPKQVEQTVSISFENSKGINAKDKVEEAELVVLDDKCNMSPSVQGKQCSKGGLESESSLERRRGLSRRTGKSCKLALTFTNQSSSPPPSQSPVISHLLSDPTPSMEMPSLHTLSCSSASTQTDPQDFALLWRIDQPKHTSEMFPGVALVILKGNSFRFNPKTTEEQSTCQQGVPYRVVHEKGSQIEENDFRESQSKKYNLEILRRHFRRVSMDILEDLYEKCHQDMEWTTNLLLDSGEQLYKEDEEEAELGSLVSVEESSGCQVEEKDHSIETSEKCMGSAVEQAASTNDHDGNSNNNLESSISPKSQETNLSDLSQVDDERSTGQSSQSEAEGSDKHETFKPCTLDQPTEDTKGEIPKANVTEQNKTDQQGQSQEETIGTESKQIVQSAKGALEDGLEIVEDDEVIRADVDAITQLLLREIDEIERREEVEKKERERERRRRKPNTMDIQTLELKLQTELALQLTELFGPVGVSPGAFSPDDCAVQIDLSLAKLLHQKWKETIQEKHRRAAMSYQLMPENIDHGREPKRDQSGLYEEALFMDHWSASGPPVSLRDIMIEEQVMQDSIEKSRSSRKDLEKKDGSAKLKENQLFAQFPTIDRHFLMDIFRDHNYSLEQTEQFLQALLDDGPVQNVVAPEPAPQRNSTSRPQSKERKWKQKDVLVEAAHFQDMEDPEYEDFRTEAMLHKRRQIESFNKAAEAYRQRRKDVASFYAEQGRRHGEKMREANRLAAMQIFERVNASLLPQNILDLHGLHVDEAIEHLAKVLADKTSEWRQGLCGPQLSVITGKGNHSQGGVARIRPAVLDYLKSHHYSYAEPKTGLVLVTLH